MRKTEEIKTHGVLIRFQQLPFEKSRSVMLRLGKLLGPSLAQMSQDPIAALAGCVAKLDDEALETLTNDLATGCDYSPDGEGAKWVSFTKPMRSVAFEGNIQAYFGFLYEALRVNYADFFAELGLLAGPGLPGKSATPT